jgi:hypothetical protein
MKSSELFILEEGVTDLPAGISHEQQLDILIAKMESCKRALRIASKLEPADKKKYVGRIIQFMYDIRLAINKVTRDLEAEASK